jgi:hypothetical protein
MEIPPTIPSLLEWNPPKYHIWLQGSWTKRKQEPRYLFDKKTWQTPKLFSLPVCPFKAPTIMGTPSMNTNASYILKKWQLMQPQTYWETQMWVPRWNNEKKKELGSKVPRKCNSQSGNALGSHWAISCTFPHLWRCVSHLNTLFWPHGPLHYTFNCKLDVRVVTRIFPITNPFAM